MTRPAATLTLAAAAAVLCGCAAPAAPERAAGAVPATMGGRAPAGDLALQLAGPEAGAPTAAFTLPPGFTAAAAGPRLDSGFSRFSDGAGTSVAVYYSAYEALPACADAACRVEERRGWGGRALRLVRYGRGVLAEAPARFRAELGGVVAQRPVNPLVLRFVLHCPTEQVCDALVERLLAARLG